jgi:MFS transporter, SHS family, lactate transporter
MADEKQQLEHVPSGEPEKMGIGRYLATRIPTLMPTFDKAENPFKLLALLNLQQWMFFLVAFIAWTWDALDFFSKDLPSMFRVG